MSDPNALLYLAIPDDEALEYLRRVVKELHRALDNTTDLTAPVERLDPALHPVGEVRRDDNS